MQSKFFFLLFLAALLFQCKKEAAPLPTLKDFVGKWEQQQLNDGSGGYGGQNLTIEFLPDGTFQMTRKVWTDAVDLNDTCSIRTDYIAGKFSLDGSTVRLEGEFYDSNFQNIIQHCTGAAQYLRSSQVQFLDGELLLFSSPSHPKARMLRQ